MKAIILAAGRGSRMKEGTADIPKGMMLLCGIPLLARALQSLEQAGFARSDIGIVTGYRRDKIQFDGVKYFHNDAWETTNMFVSLQMAEEWLHQEPCIVCYADIVFSPAVIGQLAQDDSPLAITYYTGYWQLWARRFENPLEDLETFRQRDGYLVDIGRRPSSREEVEGQYMGLLRFTPESWAEVEQAITLPMAKPVQKLDMTTLLGHLLAQGVPIRAIKTDDLWLECDNQQDIDLYEREYGSLLNNNSWRE